MRIAFIAGTSIAQSSLFDDWAYETIETAYGSVQLKKKGDLILLNRHNFENPVPPHSINYRANIRALKDSGIESVISLNSVGSLKEGLPPGTIVSCDDYVSFAPYTFHDNELSGQAPVIANNLIPEIAAASDYSIEMGKVYVQTRGPRFETKAEVRIIKEWGDVVGMTLAGEADLCQELDIAYNSICMIDNYAHGLMEQELSYEKFRTLVKENQEKVNRFFGQILSLYCS
jgi:5'-methylthioadenosine phosphorylase